MEVVVVIVAVVVVVFAMVCFVENVCTYSINTQWRDGVVGILEWTC